MPTYARRQIVVEDEVGVYHCIARCVRRAFLCGVDPYTGQDFSHRKEWILNRMRDLAGLFAIEVCGYSVMSNHLHLVLRNRPDIAEQWSADEIALRWRRLFPPRDDATGEPVEPVEPDLAMITANSERLAELRKRLANLSWFMRCLCEKIARTANDEDESNCDRPDAWLCELTLQEKATEPASTTAVSAASPPRESASQAEPIETATADAVGGAQPAADFGPTTGVAAPVEAPRRLRVRASDQGFLPIPVEHYVMLLDWTGRELRADKRGAIPDHLAPIVDRLGLNRSNWVDTVRGFGRLFKQAAGRSSSLVDAAARRSRHWFQGKAAARAAFV